MSWAGLGDGCWETDYFVPLAGYCTLCMPLSSGALVVATATPQVPGISRDPCLNP